MIWFTADPHYWHDNILKYCNRPYADVEEMNEMLIHNWNSVVAQEDTVYCLGDFSLAFRSVELFSNRLLGTKKLVPGNHDFCHPAHKKGKKDLPKWVSKYEEHGWEVLPIHSGLNIPGVGVVNLSHMPYRGDYTDERYPEFRVVGDGRWLLCGHVHEKWKTRGKMVNVGVDQWDYKPVSIDAIARLITDASNT